MKLSFYGLFERVHFLENQDNQIYDAEIKDLKNEIKKRLSYVFNDFVRKVPYEVYPYLNGKYDFIIRDLNSNNRVEVEFEFDPHIEDECKVCFYAVLYENGKENTFTDYFNSNTIVNYWDVLKNVIRC
jgi:hypothetical protein